MHWQDYLADPALSAFVALEDGPARMLVRRGLEPAAPLLGLHGDPASDEWISGGRQAHPVVTLANGTQAVVRRYRRGGAVRHLNRATYFGGHRAFEELRATEQAWAGGVRVPVVLAATERRTGLGYAAWLATTRIGGVVDGASWLRGVGAPGRLRMLREAGRQVGRMHVAGITHPDLNLRNLLVAPQEAGDPAVWLIDFDRARLHAAPLTPPEREPDIQRLGRSAAKLGLALDSNAWTVFRAGYIAEVIDHLPLT